MSCTAYSRATSAYLCMGGKGRCVRACAGDMDYQGSADEEEDDEATLDQEELLAAKDGTHQVLNFWSIVSSPVP